MKTSTQGKRSASGGLGLTPTMQPIRPITVSGLRRFMGARAPSLPMALSSALWRTTQVLTTITSAASACSTG